MPSDNVTEAIDHLTESMLGIGETFVLLLLVVLAIWFTITMFRTRERMLGFASAGAWMIAGGYVYVTYPPHDWTNFYYWLFWFFSIGMFFLCAIGQYGLREKENPLDTGEKEEPDVYTGEEKEPKAPESELEDDGYLLGSTHQPSSRVLAVRERAKERRERSGVRKKIKWGLFG